MSPLLTQVDAVGYEDNSAVHRAAEQGSVPLVRLLVEVGVADLSLTNAAGNTALMIACENGHVDVVRYLLQRQSVQVSILQQSASEISFFQNPLRIDKVINRVWCRPTTYGDSVYIFHCVCMFSFCFV